MPRAVRTTRTEPRTLHRDLPSVVNADEVLNPRTACAKEQPLVCLGSGRRRMAYGAGYPAVSAENPESRRHPIAPACVWRRARAGKRLDPAAAGRCRLRQAAVVPDSRVGSAWRASRGGGVPSLNPAIPRPLEATSAPVGAQPLLKRQRNGSNGRRGSIGRAGPGSGLNP